MSNYINNTHCVLMNSKSEPIAVIIEDGTVPARIKNALEQHEDMDVVYVGVKLEPDKDNNFAVSATFTNDEGLEETSYYTLVPIWVY